MSKLLSMLHTVNSESPDLSGLFTLWDFCLPSFIVPPNGHAVFYALGEEFPLGERTGSLRRGQWRVALSPGWRTGLPTAAMFVVVQTSSRFSVTLKARLDKKPAHPNVSFRER